jgi:hypothetical protein
MVAQVRYLVVGRSRGRVAPCAVCTVHVETRNAGFLVEPQNQGRTIYEWFGLKTTPTVSHQFGPQNRWRRFLIGLGLKIGDDGFSSFFASKPVAMVSSGLASKPVATVSQFGPQN